MPRATWNGKPIAEANDDEVERVEGNVYFPPGAIDKACLRDSATHSVCPWKGTASYYDVVGTLPPTSPAASLSGKACGSNNKTAVVPRPGAYRY